MGMRRFGRTRTETIEPLADRVLVVTLTAESAIARHAMMKVRREFFACLSQR
jgi:hypothetical protein